MTTTRQTKVGAVTIKLEARDQYNDYSVIYDHFVTVDYGNGRASRHDVGTNRAVAIDKFNAACLLAKAHHDYTLPGAPKDIAALHIASAVEWTGAPKLSAKLGQS